MSAPTSASPPTPERLMQFAWGFAPPLLIETGLKLGIFAALDETPLTSVQLAERVDASERGVRLLCNGLVGIGLLARDGDLYTCTPESSAFLVPTKPSFFGGFFKHLSVQLMPKWLQLTEVTRTGRPAVAVNQEGDGSAFFADFVEDLVPMSWGAAHALAESLDVASAPGEFRVLDLAAGSGVWSIAFARQSPRVRVTAVDWPAVLPSTQRITARFGVHEQYTYVAGDLDSADFGRDHHAATLGHILHSEGEARSRQLLLRTFQAMAPGGTIAIAEFLKDDDGKGPATAAIFGVNMLVNTDAGDTYSFAEISGWLKDAGFENPRLLNVQGPSPLILANRPRG